MNDDNWSFPTIEELNNLNNIDPALTKQIMDLLNERINNNISNMYNNTWNIDDIDTSIKTTYYEKSLNFRSWDIVKKPTSNKEMISPGIKFDENEDIK